jgi:DNA-binding Lrp family transcriptional regulator
VDAESRRDLQLLDALERESTLTQRTLASRLGIALGLTNLYLKRLVRKGYVKCVTVAPNRLIYLVTPRGVARRARLTYEFMKYSLDFYRDARAHLRRTLASVVTAPKRVALYGTGDVAEMVFLLLKEMGVELVAVYDDVSTGTTGANGANGANGTNGTFLGYAVGDIRAHDPGAFDILIVAVLTKPAAARKRVIAAGVNREKVLMLQPSPEPVEALGVQVNTRG